MPNHLFHQKFKPDNRANSNVNISTFNLIAGKYIFAGWKQ